MLETGVTGSKNLKEELNKLRQDQLAFDIKTATKWNRHASISWQSYKKARRSRVWKISKQNLGSNGLMNHFPLNHTVPQNVAPSAPQVALNHPKIYHLSTAHLNENRRQNQQLLWSLGCIANSMPLVVHLSNSAWSLTPQTPLMTTR